MTIAVAQTYESVTPYIVPITMGDQTTAMQNVYRSAVTTPQGPIVPLCVVSLQRDLDRQPVGVGRVMLRTAKGPPFGSTWMSPSIPSQEALQPVAEEADEVVIDTHRVLTAERESHQWEQMTEPARARPPTASRFRGLTSVPVWTSHVVRQPLLPRS